MSWTPTGIEPMEQERERERERARDSDRGQGVDKGKGRKDGVTCSNGSGGTDAPDEEY